MNTTAASVRLVRRCDARDADRRVRGRQEGAKTRFEISEDVFSNRRK